MEPLPFAPTPGTRHPNPAREKTKGPTPKSRTLSDLHVCQISDVMHVSG